MAITDKRYATITQVEKTAVIVAGAAMKALINKLPAYLEKQYGLSPLAEIRTRNVERTISNQSNENMEITNAERVRQLSSAAADPMEAKQLHARGFWSERKADGSLGWYRKPPALGSVLYRTMGEVSAGGNGLVKAPSMQTKHSAAVAAQLFRTQQEILKAKIRGLRLSVGAS